ncbi:hypothetical protein AOQ84DRAFT_65589 [Glonium stellatum]|uniref:DUF7918 domain-containing protein n=1 Tax=Glonium stellatum TaxID=574774 RepID=A0A8E2EY65_9PEZI|nr:hypothetical protein AOQ84DRAFT_65589 [Glonium stellatum]
MPKLKDLDCSIELGRSNEKLREYGASYADGVVEAFVAIPSTPKNFTIHLLSTGYIAPGLAMFVYIDGVYQCNRNRQGLVIPDDVNSSSNACVDFRVRQKEERQADGKFMGREWNFEKLNVVSADEAPDVSPDVLMNIGTIEVVVLRCNGRLVDDKSPKRRSSKPTTSTIIPSTAPARRPKPSSPAKKASPKLAVQDDNEGIVGDMFGIFDGSADYEDQNFTLDGQPGDSGKSGYYGNRRHGNERPSHTNFGDSDWQLRNRSFEHYNSDWPRSKSFGAAQVETILTTPGRPARSKESNFRDRPHTAAGHVPPGRYGQDSYHQNSILSETTRRHRRRSSTQSQEEWGSHIDPGKQPINIPPRPSYHQGQHSPKSYDWAYSNSYGARKSSNPWDEYIDESGWGAQPSSWRVDQDRDSGWATGPADEVLSWTNTNDEGDQWEPDFQSWGSKVSVPPPNKQYRGYPKHQSDKTGASKLSQSWQEIPAWARTPSVLSMEIPNNVNSGSWVGGRGDRQTNNASPIAASRGARVPSGGDSKGSGQAWKKENSNEASKENTWISANKSNTPCGSQPDASKGKDTPFSGNEKASGAVRRSSSSENPWENSGNVRPDQWNSAKGGNKSGDNNPWNKENNDNDNKNQSKKCGTIEKAGGKATSWNDDRGNPPTTNTRRNSTKGNKDSKERSGNQGWASADANRDDQFWNNDDKNQNDLSADQSWNNPADIYHNDTSDNDNGGGNGNSWDDNDNNAVETSNWDNNDNNGNSGMPSSWDTQNDQANDENNESNWNNNQDNDLNNNTSNWNNNSNYQTNDQGDNWNQSTHKQEFTSKKEKPKPVSHHNKSTPSKPSSGPDVSPKPYWPTWATTQPPQTPPPKDIITSPNGRAATLYLEPEELLYKVPETLAEKEQLEHQVRVGKGAEYHHRVGRPAYIDSLEKPYAVFRFKYRSRSMLKRILGDEFDEGLEDESEEMVKEKLMGLSKEEIIEEFLRVRAASGSGTNLASPNDDVLASASNDQASVHSGASHSSTKPVSAKSSLKSGSKKAPSSQGSRYGNDDCNSGKGGTAWNHDRAGSTSGGGWNQNDAGVSGAQWDSKNSAKGNDNGNGNPGNLGNGGSSWNGGGGGGGGRGIQW